MHTPETVAFEIYLGKKQKRSGEYRPPFLTIWHVDPCKDGSDDSCGWFMRSHHGDPKMLERIRKAIDSNFDSTYTSDSNGVVYNTGLFTPFGLPVMSTMAISLQMFNSAAWEFFKYDRKKHGKWMQKNLYEILQFAENPVDSLRTEIEGIFRIGCREPWKREEALSHYANIIYGWLLRSNRKWYQHPKWHIHHWKLQFHPWQQFKRKHWDKCCECGKRGFKGAAMSDWDGTKRWHMECDKSAKNPEPIENITNLNT